MNRRQFVHLVDELLDIVLSFTICTRLKRNGFAPLYTQLKQESMSVIGLINHFKDPFVPVKLNPFYYYSFAEFFHTISTKFVTNNLAHNTTL